MKVNDLFHGFRVKSVTELEEIKAKMWRMEYEKNGADLVWFEREDANANMTFGIGFKTVPDDDTGVFHIIEHSVLCGSDKYPVKEPFVELIKSSVNTFLNAMTYNDKTVYPICSRNKKDFLNLMDVYLDAVFHPLSIRNPLAFRQEGWHWDIDDEGKASANGVVYSEMKGAYASADRIIFRELYRSLFPENCYSKESGGDPEHITELTYEKYRENHQRFYSATNSRIFLDGIIDLDPVFEKLDSFLSEYDRIEVNADIPFQQPVEAPEKTVFYPIGDDEKAEKKTMLCRGYVIGDFREHLKFGAADLLFDVLCGNNEAPVKKAVLESGLAEDVSMFVDGGIQQIPVCIKIKNTDAENKDKLWALIEKELRNQIENGIDKEELEATLNAYEFNQREQEDGLKGLGNCLNSMNAWLYGGDPASVFDNNEILKQLREKINDGSRFYENLLEDMFFTCRHTASVVLLPSKTLAAEQLAAEAERCRKASESWSKWERKKVEDDLAELKRFQATEDREEDVAKLPRLKISDLTEKVPPVRAKIDTFCGRPLLRNPQDTNGIVYGRVLFNMDDITNDELNTMLLVDEIIGDIGTKKHTAQQILHIQKRDLGAFYTGISSTKIGADSDDTKHRLDFSFFFSVLESKKDMLLEHLLEVINETVYNDENEILIHVRHRINVYESRLKTSGHAFATKRAKAGMSEHAYVNELLSGFESLKYFRKLREKLEAEGTAAVVADMEKVTAKIFNRSRMAVSITENAGDEWLEKLFSGIHEGEKAGPAFRRGKLAKFNEGIEIPAQIGFAAMAGYCPDDFVYDGSCSVTSQIISYDYLWNEVRVKGGAYGTWLNISRAAGVAFSSYRDPHCANSLDVYTKAADHLREVADENDFENFVIAAYGSANPLLTPASESSNAENMWLSELPFTLLEQRREEMLKTDAAKLRESADLLDYICAHSTVCVIGGAEILKACGDKLDKITKMSDNG